MEEKIKRLFDNFKKHGLQSDFITFSQFKKILLCCKNSGVETFYYSPVFHGFYLDSCSICVKYFGEIEFNYEDGINCLNVPQPEVFNGIKFQFFPEKSVTPIKVKKETKQVTF